MVIEISMIVITIAFVVLVIYLIRTLQAFKHSILHAEQTLDQVQRQLDELGKEALQWLQNCNQLTADVQSKLKSIHSVFQSAERICEATEKVALTAKQISVAIAANANDTLRAQQKKLNEVIGWTNLFVNAWQRWQSHGDGKKQN